MTPDDLVEIEAIKRLKYTYLRCLDQKLWDELGECFMPEATAAYSGGKYSYDGRDAIVGFLSGRWARGLPLEPPLPPPRDRPHRPGTATGVWALEDTVIMGVGPHVHGAAFYTDTYRTPDEVGASRTPATSAPTRRSSPGQRRRPRPHRRVVGHRRPEQAPRRLAPPAQH